jgi:transposase
MKVRLTKPLGDVARGGVIHRVGAILDVSDGVGEMWIARGRAKRMLAPRKPRKQGAPCPANPS